MTYKRQVSDWLKSARVTNQIVRKKSAERAETSKMATARLEYVQSDSSSCGVKPFIG